MAGRNSAEVLKMMNDTLSNALSTILNNELVSKRECFIKPVSRLIKTVLIVMRDNKYIGDCNGGYRKMEEDISRI